MIALSLDKAFGGWERFPKGIIGIVGVLIVLDRFVRIALLPGRDGKTILDLERIGGAAIIVNFGTSSLAWSRIESFGWEKEAGTMTTLALYKRSKILFFTSANVTVQLELMKQIEGVLEQHNVPRQSEDPKLDV